MNKMREFRRQLRSSVGKPLAYQIRDGFGASVAGVLERVIRGQRVHDAELSEVLAYDDDDDDGARPQRVSISAGPVIVPGAGQGKATAIVTMRGVALYDLEFQPYCYSSLLLAQTMSALANDAAIGTILLDIATPGGQVTGTPEAADAVYAARQKKRVVALVNPLCASAGYFVASQATHIVAVKSADIGSIGVFMMHADCSGLMEQMGVKPTFIFAGENKVEGNPYEPLSDDAKGYFQSEVDTLYGDFLKAVARGRGISVQEVEERFGKGRTMLAPEAKKVGMIDEIATVEGALARVGVTMIPGRDRRGEHEDPAPQAEAGAETAAMADTEAAPKPNARHRRLALLRA